MTIVEYKEALKNHIVMDESVNAKIKVKT